MEAQRTGHGAPSPRSAEPKAATIAARVSRLWRLRIRSPGVGREHQLETLEARMGHLEAALEALQDTVYRQAVLEAENIGELRRRTEPEQMARDLSRDARRRGL
jgi:hypothetical protein